MGHTACHQGARQTAIERGTWQRFLGLGLVVLLVAWQRGHHDEGSDSHVGPDLTSQHRPQRNGDVVALERQPAHVVQAQRLLDGRQRVVGRDDAGPVAVILVGARIGAHDHIVRVSLGGECRQDLGARVALALQASMVMSVATTETTTITPTSMKLMLRVARGASQELASEAIQCTTAATPNMTSR